MGRIGLMAVTAFFASMATGNLSAQYELVQVIVDRKAIMHEMQSAYWPLLEIKNGESADLATAAQASQSIADALGPFSELLLPGTARGEVPGSRATPEVWSEPADFASATDALREAAEALSDAASSGDLELFKARFDTFASACTGCHEFKPSSGGRFRAQF